MIVLSLGHVAAPRFAEVALSSTLDIPDGPRHMVAGGIGGIVGSFVAWLCLGISGYPQGHPKKDSCSHQATSVRRVNLMNKSPSIDIGFVSWAL